MNNLDKYKKAFIDGLSVEANKVNDDLKYNDIPEWDSIGHMTLMSNLEKLLKLHLRQMILLILVRLKKVKKFLINIK